MYVHILGKLLYEQETQWPLFPPKKVTKQLNKTGEKKQVAKITSQVHGFNFKNIIKWELIRRSKEFLSKQRTFEWSKFVGLSCTNREALYEGDLNRAFPGANALEELAKTAVIIDNAYYDEVPRRVIDFLSTVFSCAINKYGHASEPFNIGEVVYIGYNQNPCTLTVEAAEGGPYDLTYNKSGLYGCDLTIPTDSVLTE